MPSLSVSGAPQLQLPVAAAHVGVVGIMRSSVSLLIVLVKRTRLCAPLRDLACSVGSGARMLSACAGEQCFGRAALGPEYDHISRAHLQPHGSTAIKPLIIVCSMCRPRCAILKCKKQLQVPTQISST